jgi:hypothetical protein
MMPGVGFEQVESALAIQNLKPQIDEIKRLYGDDKDKIQREQSALYEEAGVNPTAGTEPLFIYPEDEWDWYWCLLIDLALSKHGMQTECVFSVTRQRGKTADGRTDTWGCIQ